MTGGMLMPTLKYRFRVTIPVAAQQLLTQQVRCCSIDIIKRNLYLEITQPIVFGLINSINKARRLDKIWIDLFDGNHNVSVRLTLSGCKMVEHKFDLNYADSEIAKHCLTYEFKTIKEYLPISDMHELLDYYV